MDEGRSAACGKPYLYDGRSTIEGLPVVELGVEGAGGGVVVQLHQSRVVLPQDLSDQHTIGEIPRQVAFGPAEGETVDPLQQLLHLVLVDRGRFHQRTIIAAPHHSISRVQQCKRKHQRRTLTAIRQQLVKSRLCNLVLIARSRSPLFSMEWPSAVWLTTSLLQSPSSQQPVERLDFSSSTPYFSWSSMHFRFRVSSWDFFRTN